MDMKSVEGAQVVGRVAAILRAVSAAMPDGVGTTALATRIGLSRPTTRAEDRWHRAATSTTGWPSTALWMAWARVVPARSRLPASRAVFWSTGLVKANTSAVRGAGRNSW